MAFQGISDLNSLMLTALIEAVSAAGFALYEPASEPRLVYPAVITFWFFFMPSVASGTFVKVRSNADMARLCISPPRGQRGKNICNVRELVTLVVVLLRIAALSQWHHGGRQ